MTYKFGRVVIYNFGWEFRLCVKLESIFRIFNNQILKTHEPRLQIEAQQELLKKEKQRGYRNSKRTKNDKQCHLPYWTGRPYSGGSAQNLSAQK